MPGDPLPSPEEAIRELAAEVAARIRRGEKPAAIRAELLREGLDAEIVDHILAESAAYARSGTRTTIAMIVSGVVVIACSLAGFACGVWAASEIPPAPGLAVMFTCLLGVIVVACGAGAGAGAGIGIAALLAKWSEPADEEWEG